MIMGQNSEQNTEKTVTRIINGKVYKLKVHFSQTDKETIQDKIKRLIKNDIQKREYTI